MLNFTGSILFFFILLFIFAKWGPAINFNSTTQTTGQPFVVTGTGTATVAPDIAKINLGITESGTVLKTVQDSVNTKSQNLVAQIKKLGIADKDIKTISYYVYPQYDYTTPTQRITGYQVSTSYEITIRDFTKINDLLASATSFGANTIGGVNFDLSDDLKNKTLQDARDQAVTEAKTKAEGLAKAAGITLGKIINVSEETPSSIRPLMLPSAGGGVTDKISYPTKCTARNHRNRHNNFPLIRNSLNNLLRCTMPLPLYICRTLTKRKGEQNEKDGSFCHHLFTGGMRHGTKYFCCTNQNNIGSTNSAANNGNSDCDTKHSHRNTDTDSDRGSNPNRNSDTERNIYRSGR